ncbi:helix-turn-helix domain-containing protein, partial [Klebsiella pneumoniae subsp. pneumoniae]
MTEAQQTVGSLLREWRQRRRFSQLSLAVEAEISQRHLSFLESGRSVPSRRHGSASGRTSGRAAAGAQPDTGCRRICARSRRARVGAPEFAAARSVIEALLDLSIWRPVLRAGCIFALLRYGCDYVRGNCCYE